MAEKRVDEHGLKVGQALTIGLLLVGFVLNSWLFVLFVAVSQLLGGLDAPFAPYRIIYKRLVLSSGRLQPKWVTDNPEPHRFAMLIGALFNGLGIIALLVNISLVGWALVWIVIVLANINFWLNFCLGCWMYYQLYRLGVPGFAQGPIR